MIGIFKSPTEGCGGFVVLLDVMDQLSGEVGGRSEDSPSDNGAVRGLIFTDKALLTLRLEGTI